MVNRNKNPEFDSNECSMSKQNLSAGNTLEPVGSFCANFVNVYDLSDLVGDISSFWLSRAEQDHEGAAGDRVPAANQSVQVDLGQLDGQPECCKQSSMHFEGHFLISELGRILRQFLITV
jgi:hypothetical protein